MEPPFKKPGHFLVNYIDSRISLRNASQFLNARNGVGHQVKLVEEIIPDLLWGLAIFSAKGAKSYSPVRRAGTGEWLRVAA